MRRTLAATVALIGASALALAGCSGSDDGTAASGTPTVVTSTNVWGSVASAVAGEKATVTTLYTNAEGDPHEFEPSTEPARRGERRACAVCGNTERATIHGR